MNTAGRIASISWMITLCACFDLGTAEWILDGDAAISSDDGSVASTACLEITEPRTFIVEIVANSFRPKLTQICAGDEIIWRNNDSQAHNLQMGTPEMPTEQLATNKLFLGDTYQRPFETRGEFVYFCPIHKKKMRDAQIIVE